MQVDRPVAVPGHALPEKAEKRSLAHAGLAGDESELRLASEEFQAGQGLSESVVGQQPVRRRGLAKRVVRKFEISRFARF